MVTLHLFPDPTHRGISAFSPWVSLDTGIPVQRATTSAMCCGVTVSTNNGDSVDSSYLGFKKK